MGSSSTQEWLELSLGLRSTEKEHQQKEEKEDEKRSRLYQEKLVVCGTTSHEESEYVNLDLRLQIGPNNKRNHYNMGIRDFMLQHQSNKKHFRSDYSSTTNSAGLWFSLLSSPNRSKLINSFLLLSFFLIYHIQKKSFDFLLKINCKVLFVIYNSLIKLLTSLFWFIMKFFFFRSM